MTSLMDGHITKAPAAVRAPMPTGATYLQLAFMVIVWGSNYSLMKLAIADMPPLAFTAARLFGAACVFGAILAVRRSPLLPVPGERWPLAVAGLFQMAGLFGFTIIGLMTVAPGRAGLLVYTMQLWSVPLGIWLLGERPTRSMLFGSILGLAGIMLYFNPAATNWHTAGALAGSAWILLAAISWAFGSCLYRRGAWRSGFMVQTLWQMAVSTVPIAVLSLILERHGTYHIGPQLVAIVLYNCFVPTALALWCWAKVLSVMPVSTAGQVLLLTPIVGFIPSALFLGEPITLTLVASGALIAAGVSLTMRSRANGKLRNPPTVL